MNCVVNLYVHLRDCTKIFLAYQIRKSEVFACDRNSYLTYVISSRRSAGNLLHPFLETSKFQHIVVSLKSVSFSLNCPKTSECQYEIVEIF